MRSVTHCNVGQYSTAQWPAVPEVLFYVLAIIQTNRKAFSIIAVPVVVHHCDTETETPSVR